MRLICREVAGLAKLAWVAAVDPSEGTALVSHGPLVEARRDFFVEGVWDGDFAAGQFGRTENFFGSGGLVDGQDVVFVSSASTADYLYHKQQQGVTVVANSLPLLLAQLDDRLDPQYAGYEEINYSIIKGIDSYTPDIPTTNGVVHRLMFRNLRVGPTGVRQEDKPMPPEFPAYEVYFEYLQSRYGRIAANARETARRYPLAIFSTQSRGYDTTAVNAVAARSGVDAAFTVTKGKVAGAFVDRESGAGVNDDGTDIAKALGIRCVPIDRRSFEQEFDEEYLYLATLDKNADVNMHGLTKHITGPAMLLTGTLGELWYTRQSYEGYIRRFDLLDSQIKRVDLGGHGLTEVRLACGFVHLPFPYIGARRRKEIFAITESTAMDPWRLRNEYDRPIPRRMAEDAGVPRELFGQKKIATAVEFPPPPVPHGSALRAEYFEFLTRHGLLHRWQLPLFPLVHRINSTLWFASETRHRVTYYAQRAVSKLLRRNFRVSARWRNLNGRLFCFCANKRADEFARMLSPAAVASVPARQGS